MQFKTILRLHLTPVKMVKMSNKNESTCEWAFWKMGLIHCWSKCNLVQPLWKSVYNTIELYHFKIISYYRDICSSMFITAQLVIARNCNSLEVHLLTKRWWEYANLHNAILLTLTKKIMRFTGKWTWLETIIKSKITLDQTDKKKSCFLLCRLWLLNFIHLFYWDILQKFGTR